MALDTKAIKADLDRIPATTVSKWDFALGPAETQAGVVKEVFPDRIVLCSGATVDKESITWRFYQNPQNKRNFAVKL